MSIIDSLTNDQLLRVFCVCKGEVVSIQTPTRAVALTFDDGPDNRWSPTILRTLREHGAYGTFFATGKQLSNNLRLGNQILEEGHELGTHTFSHEKGMSSTKMLKDIQKAIRVHETELAKPQRPRWFRFPYGQRPADLTGEQLSAIGLTSIRWSIDSRDYRLVGADQIVATVRDKARRGSIVLLHDGIGSNKGCDRDQTVEALPELLNVLDKKGLRALTLSELVREAICAL